VNAPLSGGIKMRPNDNNNAMEVAHYHFDQVSLLLDYSIIRSFLLLPPPQHEHDKHDLFIDGRQHDKHDKGGGCAVMVDVIERHWGKDVIYL
jgi:hypothetical protein